jgi:hypothetical protein
VSDDIPHEAVVVEIDVDELRERNGDLWAVACNYREATKTVRDGARAYLVWTTGGMGYQSQQVRVRSRGGRWITKWDRAARLTNFRAACVMASDPLYRDRQVELYLTRAAAEARAAEMMAVSRREATALQAR